jgi:hypothetical protein
MVCLQEVNHQESLKIKGKSAVGLPVLVRGDGQVPHELTKRASDNRGPLFKSSGQNGAESDASSASLEAVEPELTVSGSGSPRSSLRTTSARMHQNVCLFVLAFLPLPFPRSYVVLTRLPSTSTCEPFLIVVATYSASRGRNTQTRCHSVFEAHSSSVSSTTAAWRRKER